MAFIKFMVSTAGRLVRVIAGLLLITIGLIWVNGTGGTIMVLVGVVPLLTGMFDVCLFAPLFGLPFTGSQVRQM